MTFTYIDNIPNGPDNPSNDQPNMQINTNSISGILGVDHVGFNLPNGGYHTIIHQVPLVSDPSPIAGIGQLYSKNVTINATTDTQLFYITGLGGISELTGSSATANGFVWAGGILFQWGKVNSITDGSVSFNSSPNFNFPHGCFSVQTTPFWVGSSEPNGAAGISVKNISNTGFTWVFNTNSSQYTGGGFYWFAVGA